MFYDQTLNQLRCDLADDFKSERIQEGLAEELRLLYVGLTRSTSKCYLAMPSFTENKKAYRLNKAISDSALKHVLFADESISSQAVPNVWEHLSGFNHRVFDLEIVSDQVTTLQAEVSQAQLSAKEYNGYIKRDWYLSSFSSLVRDHHAPQSARFNLDDDVQSQENSDRKESVNITETVEEGENQFSFPRGAHAGNFLHTLLEEIDFTKLPEDLDTLIVDLLVRFGIEEKWLSVVRAWLDIMLTSPLSHQGLSLSKLSEDLKQVEMEFYFPISKLSSRDFNALLNQYSVLQCPVTDVAFNTIRGMMKGFIDLTFCWDDQYFILDYKSNHLGDHFECYQESMLQQAMGEHRYDIQLVLYTLALHRLLRLRIPNYDYDKQIGGGYYLFLRGLNLNDHNGQFFHKPAKELIFAIDDLINDTLNTVETTLRNDSREDGQMEFLV